MDALASLRKTFANLIRMRSTLAPEKRTPLIDELVEGAGTAIIEMGGGTACKGCGMTTPGAVGAAGIYWTFLCQGCKDKADKEARDHVRALACTIPVASAKALATCPRCHANLVLQPADPDAGIMVATRGCTECDYVVPVEEPEPAELAFERRRDEEAPLVVTGPGGVYTRTIPGRNDR